MLLEHVPAAADRTQTFSRCRCVAIVAAKIGQGLFALENRGDVGLPMRRPKSRDIGAITALGQADFGGARCIPVRLGPEKRETF
jgi:hypothetical protein